MSKLVLLLLVIISVLLYTSCDYSLLQQHRTPTRFLTAPVNSKLTLEGALGIVLDQGSQKLNLTTSDIQFSINSTPMMTLTSQRLQINPGRLLLSGDTAALYIKDTNRGIMYSKVPNGIQNFTTTSPKDGLAVYGYLDGCLGTTDVANGGAKAILRWASTGSVSINPVNTTDTYPLSVYGFTNTQRGNSYIYMKDAASGSGDFRASIYSQYGVVSGAYGFMTLSDMRIKKNISLSTGALDVINRINVVKYEHIDQTKERVVEFGVVAQQLKECLPSAVHQISDWVPNIYQRVEKQIKSGNTVNLFFAERVPQVTGKLLRLVGEKDILVRILSQGTHSLIVDEYYPVEQDLFAYGTREDDFLVVDKQQLAVLAVQGVKELMVEFQDLRRQLNELQK